MRSNIMKKLKLYIETSTWNFMYADDAPEKKELTQTFFSLVEKQTFEIYISDIVLREFDKAPQIKKDQLLKLIKKFSPILIETTPDANLLAQKYLSKNIIPANKLEDALHVAVATVAELDAVVTWNYRHLANLRREELFQSVNLELGYLKKIELITPMEVIGDEIR